MKYTPDQLEFLRLGYLEMRVPELTQAFNAAYGTGKTRAAIKSALTKNGFTCGRPTGTPKGAYLLFTRQQADFIQEHYATLSRHDLTTAINARFRTDYTAEQITGFVKNHGIASGRTGHFQAGIASWNAGTKGLVKPNAGSFQPGSVPRNVLEMGKERITRDGYIEVKVPQRNPYTGAPTWWRFKHRLVWEANNNQIPAGHVVVFLDGDKGNCNLDNLRCVPRSVLQWMNKVGLNETTGEARKAAILTSELVTRSNQRARA